MSGGGSSSAYATGTMSSGSRIGGMMASEGRWWEAFGTGGFEGEPSLMEGEASLPLSMASSEANAEVKFRAWD